MAAAATSPGTNNGSDREKRRCRFRLALPGRGSPSDGPALGAPEDTPTSAGIFTSFLLSMVPAACRPQVNVPKAGSESQPDCRWMVPT